MGEILPVYENTDFAHFSILGYFYGRKWCAIFRKIYFFLVGENRLKNFSGSPKCPIMANKLWRGFVTWIFFCQKCLTFLHVSVPPIYGG